MRTEVARALDRRIRGYSRGDSIYDSMIFMHRGRARPAFAESFGSFFEAMRNIHWRSILLASAATASTRRAGEEELESDEAMPEEERMPQIGETRSTVRIDTKSIYGIDRAENVGNDAKYVFEFSTRSLQRSKEQ